MVTLTYAGEKGCTLIKSLKKNLQRAFAVNIQKRIVYTGIKLSSQLRNVKDAIPFEEQHDIVYRYFCCAENCNDSHIGESARRLDERMKDHNSRGYNPFVQKFSRK